MYCGNMSYERVEGDGPCVHFYYCSYDPDDTPSGGMSRVKKITQKWNLVVLMLSKVNLCLAGEMKNTRKKRNLMRSYILQEKANNFIRQTTLEWAKFSANESLSQTRSDRARAGIYSVIAEASLYDVVEPVGLDVNDLNINI